MKECAWCGIVQDGRTLQRIYGLNQDNTYDDDRVCQTCHTQYMMNNIIDVQTFEEIRPIYPELDYQEVRDLSTKMNHSLDPTSKDIIRKIYEKHISDAEESISNKCDEIEVLKRNIKDFSERLYNLK